MAIMKKTPAQKIKQAKAMATTKKVARDADSVNISDYKVQGDRTAIRNRMQLDRSRTASRADNAAAKLKKAAGTKAVVKPSAMGQSAKAHQASLAKISGTTAAIKAGKPLPKAGRNEAVAGRNAKVTIAAYNKATKKTAASFKKSK